MTDILNPIFQDADEAREHLESLRWPDGPYCPHCGEANKDRITKIAGKSARPGVYQCKSCRKQFTVTVGTVFERSKIPLNKWLLATHLMAASKKGISAHQIHRMLGVTYKTAWFMCHRIREAMKEDNQSSGPLGGSGKIVEADETYYGKRETPIVSKQRQGRPYKFRKGKGHSNLRSIVALVERGGKTRTFHVQHATAANVREVLVRNVSRKSKLVYRRKPPLQGDRQGIRRPQDGQAFRRRICARYRPFKHC